MKNNYSPLCRPVIFDLIGLVFLFAFLFLSPPLSSDPGVGWHLKTGEWILQNMAIPHSDPFLWSSSGKEWISNQWLSDVVLWLIYKAGNWDALALFCFALPLATLLCLQGRIFWKIWNRAGGELSDSAGKHNSGKLSGLLVRTFPLILITLSIFVAWIQWIVRPVIFSFSLFSLTFYLIWNFKDSGLENSRKFYTLIFLTFLLWANLHSAFPLGLCLIISALVAAAIEKKPAEIRGFATAFCLAVLATLINPYGIRLYRNIVELLGSSYFMNLNAEWQMPDFNEPLFLPLLISVCLIVFFAGRRGVSLPLWIRFILIGMVFLSLKSVRYISFLGMILPVVFAYLFYFKDLIGSEKTESHHKYCPLLFLAVALSASVLFFAVDFPGTERFSSDAIKNTGMWQKLGLVCEESGGKVYNHPNLGGAIIFKLYPRCKAGLDDRNELNGEAAYRKFFAVSAGEDLEELKNLPSLLLVSDTSKLALLAKHGLYGLEKIYDSEGYLLIFSDSGNIKK